MLLPERNRGTVVCCRFKTYLRDTRRCEFSLDCIEKHGTDTLPAEGLQHIDRYDVPPVAFVRRYNEANGFPVYFRDDAL